MKKIIYQSDELNRPIINCYLGTQNTNHPSELKALVDTGSMDCLILRHTFQYMYTGSLVPPEYLIRNKYHNPIEIMKTGLLKGCEKSFYYKDHFIMFESIDKTESISIPITFTIVDNPSESLHNINIILGMSFINNLTELKIFNLNGKLNISLETDILDTCIKYQEYLKKYENN